MVTPRYVLHAVCSALDVTEGQLRSEAKGDNLVDARWIAYHLLFTQAKMKKSDIAEMFCRFRTTIYWGLDSYQERMDIRDKSFAAKVKKVNKELEVICA